MVKTMNLIQKLKLAFRSDEQELIDRLRPCQGCLDLATELKDQKRNYNILRTVFFTEPTTSYSSSDLRTTWVISALVLSLGIVIISTTLALTSASDTSNHREIRECRQICAFIGGNSSQLIDDHCYCHTPHGENEYVQVK